MTPPKLVTGVIKVGKTEVGPGFQPKSINLKKKKNQSAKTKQKIK